MHQSLIALTLASSGFAASQNCSSDPVPCNRDTCSPCFCVGPADVIANAPVYPRTCDGDFHIEASVLYWKATQDGMEYAVKTQASSAFLDANNLIDAEYKTPNYKSDFGWKFGIGYNSACDGWDVDLLWTYFSGKASSLDQTTFGVGSEEQILIPLFSAFNGSSGNLEVARAQVAFEIETYWKSALHLIDLELGRKYWVSKYLALRPFIGLRGAQIDQNFDLHHRGGSWGGFDDPPQPPLNDEMKIDNDFRGIGVRGGMGADWHFGCGWSLYSDVAASILYGRFDIKHDENVRQAEAPFSKSDVLETKEHFRASRAILDLALGVQYAALICDCKYGITTRLAWEQHLFFHQNQMWRVNRVGFDPNANSGFRNNGGENDFEQSRGTLSTGGLTFTLGFDF